MNVGELKKLIEHLPDNTPVVNCHSGNMSYGTFPVDLIVGTVYVGTKEVWYSKTPVPVQWIETTPMKSVEAQYQALIFETEE